MVVAVLIVIVVLPEAAAALGVRGENSGAEEEQESQVYTGEGIRW